MNKILDQLIPPVIVAAIILGTIFGGMWVYDQVQWMIEYRMAG